MSLLVMCYVDNGIAIATDRRVLMKCKTEIGTDMDAYRYKNHVDSIHVCDNGCILVHQGEIIINEEPSYVWVQRFVKECIKQDTLLSDMPDILIKYFQVFSETIVDLFLIVGYDEKQRKHIYQVDVAEKNIFEYDVSFSGSVYFGNIEFISRLLEKAKLTYADGSTSSATYFKLMIQDFQLQDAIDFCRFMVDATKQMERFVDMPHLTGGATDVIAINEDGWKWIQKEEVQ